MITVIMLIFLVSGGNDILSYVDTELYWEMKKVDVTENAMMNRLSFPDRDKIDALIGQMLSDDEKTAKEAAAVLKQYSTSLAMMLAYSPDIKRLDSPYWRRTIRTGVLRGQKVMRLMAVKTLGEMKSKKSLPKLTAITGSKDPFDVLYAKNAIAAINGSTIESTIVTVPRETTPWLLTGNTIVAGQFYNKRTVDLIKVLFGRIKDCKEEYKKVKKQVHNQLLLFLERTGNIKIDTVNVSVDEYQEGGPSITVIVSGIIPASVFDHVQSGADGKKTLGDYTIFDLNSKTRAYLNGSGHLVLRHSSDNDPFAEPRKLIRSLSTGSEGLKKDPVLSSLLENVDTNANLWAVGTIPGIVKRTMLSDYMFHTFYTDLHFNETELSGRMVVTGKKEDLKKVSELINAEQQKNTGRIEKKQVTSCEDRLKLELYRSFHVKAMDDKLELKVDLPLTVN